MIGNRKRGLLVRETPKSLEAFAEYCALEDRSLEKLAKIWRRSNGKPASNLRQLQEWSRLNGWQQRVADYDVAKIKDREAKKQAAIDAMNERQAAIGTMHQKKAIEQIERLIKAEKFGSQATVQLLKLATDLERVARGAPTEHTQQSGTIDVEHHSDLSLLTDEELDMVENVMKAARERKQD